MRLWCALLVLWPALARADALDAGPAVVERTGERRVALQIEPPRPGVLDWTWTDARGRILLRRQTSTDGSTRESAIWLDLARASPGTNTVVVAFGGAEHTASFVARPAAGWPSYPVILWQAPQAQAALDRLPSLGVTAVKLFSGEPPVSPPLRSYIENIATDFYATYHRWTPTRPVTALFDDAKARHRTAPADLTVFMRTPSLSDSAALARVENQLRQATRRPDRQLFLNLGDETGIADLAAAWDFDLSPDSLAGLRDWLQAQYVGLDNLNTQWGTKFSDWSDVVPELTTAAMRRTDGNYSAWADFKAWMDEAFARSLRAGAQAIHQADPTALAGIEGAQVPGWGGYDYGRLAGAVDVMEIYDSAANLDIAHSLSPRTILLETAFETGPAEVRRLWRDRLRGVRGLVLWDEHQDIVREDGTPGPRAVGMGPVWRDLAGPAAEQFAAAEVRPDAVAILYSQASFRTEWMLAHAAGGDAWTERDAEREGEDTPWRTSLRRVQSALAHLALTPHWLDTAMVEGGALRDPALQALLLPQTLALSDREVAEIRMFRDRGGIVLADGIAGAYDAHSRKRSSVPELSDPVAWPGDEPGLAALAARLPPSPVKRVAGAEIYVRWTGGLIVAATLPDAGLDGGPVPPDGRAVHRLHVSPTIDLLGAPGQLAVQGPTRLRRGQDAAFSLSTEGAATHVVEVQTHDPGGSLASTEQVHVSGRSLWTWRPVEADPAGEWTISFADALGGAVLRRTVVLLAP